MSRTKLLTFLILSALIALAFVSSSKTITVGRAYAEGPPGGFTHAPGETDCTQCHVGHGIDTGPGHFTIQAPSNYVPGQSYQITVTHTTTDQSRKRWGFQLTALTVGLAQAGDLQASDSTAQILDGQGPGFSRQYIEHTLNGTFAGQSGGAHWTFNWTAPSSDVGTVIFYAAGNQANNDGNFTGDQIYTTSLVSRSPSFKPPSVMNATVSGKQLTVLGDAFEPGAVIVLDGTKLKTKNDPSNPATILVSKNGGKGIVPGSQHKIRVKNPDGGRSGVFQFTSPS
jgi:hypothetical protein